MKSGRCWTSSSGSLDEMNPGASFLLRRFLRGFKGARREPAPVLTPSAAYDLWAATYDRQPDNLMFHLEASLFSSLLAEIELRGKVVLDIGCGTGRHWAEILEQKPSALVGYDVASEMLERLREKYPQAQTRLLGGIDLEGAKGASADVLLSTLTLAHIEPIEETLREWNRVLRPGGDVLLTDYHPAAFAAGADRTFRHRGELNLIQNFPHPLVELQRLFRTLGWQELEFLECRIDQSVRHFYEAQQALHVFERFYGVPIVFGWRLRKA